MGSRNFYEHVWDFQGQSVFSTTAADNAPFLIKDTSAAGAPTYALATPASAGASGELAIAFDNTNEVQNVCLYQNDILQFLAAGIIEVEFRLKMAQATLNAASSLAFGVCNARNDAIASITNSALFRLVGASNVVKIDTRDGTTTNNGVSTNQTLGTTYKDFLISFAAGLGDVRFLVDGVPALVPSVPTFSLAALTGGLQLFLQLQKTAATATDGVTLDRIRIAGRRQ